jgi:hypothetical protein
MEEKRMHASVRHGTAQGVPHVCLFLADIERSAFDSEFRVSPPPGKHTKTDPLGRGTMRR